MQKYVLLFITKSPTFSNALADYDYENAKFD